MADFRLFIDAPGQAAPATNQLLQELVRAAKVDARPAPAQAPSGSKSGAGATVAELVLNGALPAAVAAAVASVVTSFVQRGSARKVTIKTGDDEITVEGVDARSQKALLETWLREHESEG
ncbi:hypothetical protein ALI22I_38520 [Saccharothrix sp. ALI-22-I]|uniref:hypothetical protein n=1 Tax=Saccharothrix sp. ALI-22-I TaxID=1933778 RepID=UPI00097BD77D|nr:hypothetical protein [Saccharothrix sp. ALI-22-I]ONI82059.1 hypothetical protein ALI22I_38520 [Saccharothrix sp. ALI-22-I]